MEGGEWRVELYIVIHSLSCKLLFKSDRQIKTPHSTLQTPHSLKVFFQQNTLPIFGSAFFY